MKNPIQLNAGSTLVINVFIGSHYLLLSQRPYMTFNLPIYWTKHFKTKPSTTHLLGMNWYRNAHHFDQNNMKKEMEQLLQNQLSSMLHQPLSKYTVEYKLFFKNPSCDGSNIIALVEKIFLDFVQSANLVTNDSVKYHLGSSWSIVDQDRSDPRCEITLKDLHD